MGSITPVAPGTPDIGWTDGFSGSGAAKGAAMGSAFGPWGALAGGALGLFGAGDLLGGHDLAPQMGANPYQGQWDALIAQLRKTASGQGPSVAGNAYKDASDKAMTQQVAMTRGGNAGAARQGAINAGQIGEGQAQGYASARLQEQMAAQAQLNQAIQGASQSWFGPQQANLLAQLQTPSNLQAFTGFAGQFGAGLAQLSKSKNGSQSGNGYQPNGYQQASSFGNYSGDSDSRIRYDNDGNPYSIG